MKTSKELVKVRTMARRKKSIKTLYQRYQDVIHSFERSLQNSPTPEQLAMLRNAVKHHTTICTVRPLLVQHNELFQRSASELLYLTLRMEGVSHEKAVDQARNSDGLWNPGDERKIST